MSMANSYHELCYGGLHAAFRMSTQYRGCARFSACARLHAD